MPLETTVAFALSTGSHLSQALCCLSSLGDTGRGDCIRRIYVVDHEVPSVVVNGVNIRSLPRELQAIVVASLQPDYSWPEICFALKALLLSYELSEGCSAAIYIDADIFFVSDARQTLGDLGAHPISLTPHCLSTDHLAGDLTDLRLLPAGVFNAGIIGLNERCPPAFLPWWFQRASRLGYNEPRYGMCGDQKWLDIVPSRFEGVNVVRDLGMNVAHWNLHERPLTIGNDGSMLSGDRLLICFHFSGFDRFNPSLLSRHSSIRIPRGTPLDTLTRVYAVDMSLCEAFSRDVCLGPPNDVHKWYQSNRRNRFLRLLGFRGPKVVSSEKARAARQ
jgi:hypothetical protein